MKKSRIVDSIRVDTPCSEDWNQMTGSGRVRFCSHCSKEVNDISAMTRKEAKKLVVASGGNLCVRYVRHPLTQAPVYADQLVQIVRRTSKLAAGVMSATLTMSALTFAQGGIGSQGRPTEQKVSQETNSNRGVAGSSGGSISGTVTDPQGALVPGATVQLFDRDGLLIRAVTSDVEGKFEFDRVADGIYKVEITSSMFTKSVIENINVAGVQNTLSNVTLSIGEQVVLMGVVAIGVEYEGTIASAVYADDIDTVSELIARGESVNKREEDRTTPLFVAVENGNLEMVRLLLAHGAKANARNKAKQAPLMRLDDDATVELVELLLAHGAKVDVTDEEGNTPLMSAAAESNADVVRALISSTTKIDAQNKEGMSALMIAAYRDDLEVVKALLEAGADVNLKDKDGETAWDKTGVDEIEDLLVAHGYVVPQEEVEDQVVEQPTSEHIPSV